MGMDMGIDFENPMGMGMTFENGYGCEYSYTRPTPIPSIDIKIHYFRYEYSIFNKIAFAFGYC